MRAVLLGGLLVGCSTTRESASVRLAPGLTPPAGESVVFGRFDVRVGGRQETWKPGVLSHGLVVDVVHHTTKRIFSYQLEGDGTFYWHLPPGEYTIGKATWDQFSYAFIQVSFRVPPGQNAVYIGTLRLDYEGFLVRCGVSDERQEAVPVFQTMFPGFPSLPSVSLMKSAEAKLVTPRTRLPLPQSPFNPTQSEGVKW
jgi:hypothetical protein